ncbi:MAG: hypothetical protein J5851_08380 [Oscillospiraceae bacterium]|nr:hypothetical protein [Oscillospiraceae bacterium]
MKDSFADIISHPHFSSTKRAHMSMASRAAQFAPFAALTGFDDEISETARLTDEQHELTEDEAALLNEQLHTLLEIAHQKPLVTVVCFRPDPLKPGGAYVTYTGHFRYLNEAEMRLEFAEGQSIALADVVAILHILVQDSRL